MSNPFHHQTCGQKFFDWALSNSKMFSQKVIGELIFNKDIVYSKSNYFKNYKGKKILIIGGGPSSKNLDLLNTEVDFLWSVNHFYLNPTLKDKKIDLAMMMAEPDLKSKEFLNYRDKFKPMIGFEIHSKWLNYKFDDYENYFLMNTHFYGKLGACTRMIIFACLLGVSEIKFVGMDGDKYMKEGNHAFQPNKKALPSSYTNNLFKDEYKVFWEYVDNTFPKVKIINLGFGQEYHNR
jgi:hypothetical protein